VSSNVIFNEINGNNLNESQKDLQKDLKYSQKDIELLFDELDEKIKNINEKNQTKSF
jgi:peptidoglycan hydrolase CwlO-like protein